MSTKYKFRDQEQLYFVSFSVVNWIDLFIRKEYKEIILDSWKHCQANKGLEIYGWCIMTSHIHMTIGNGLSIGSGKQIFPNDVTSGLKGFGTRSV